MGTGGVGNPASGRAADQPTRVAPHTPAEAATGKDWRATPDSRKLSATGTKGATFAPKTPEDRIVPELPDVRVFAAYLDATSLHQEIDAVSVRDGRLLAGVSRKKLISALRGRKLDATRCHGKHLCVALDVGPSLVLHFGMTGALQYHKFAEDEPAYTQFLMRFTNGYHLAYVSRRRLGRIRLVDDFDVFIERQKLGPDALDVDEETFRERIRRGRGAIKSTLMNQNTLAGLGNVYVDELLYFAGVRPTARVDRADDDTLHNVYLAMRHVLRTAIKDKADLDAMPDSWLLPQRGRNGKCPKHGRKLTRTKVGGRTTYYCPKCQPAR